MGPDANLPRGFRDNNPLNIEVSPHFQWVGEEIVSDYPYCRFKEMKYGIRAGYIILLHYWNFHGLKCISDIIIRFAPPKENDTLAYISDVAMRTGFGRDQVLDPTKDFPMLVDAMIHHELGGDFVSYGEVKAAQALLHNA